MDNNSSPNEQKNNPLHGVKLINILEVLLEHYHWNGLAEKININCFKENPSIKSSLKFLRKTPWAREKVEQLYLDLLKTK
ncbi:MAG TPA: VF530 family protein [Chitinophagales bacterium]|nr:VF530 family protein [Chitinophagales bacterium]